VRHALLWISLSGLVAASSAFAAATTGNSGIISASANGIVGSTNVTPPLDALRQQRAIAALERERRELQRTDGGALTPAHHIYLQTKLNAILAGHY
jgi:hypothetical protein